VNPYEHYRFNVGASSPRKRPSATDKRAGGLAGRRALLAAAEKKEKERTKDTEMTDLDLIKENMADKSGKVRLQKVTYVMDATRINAFLSIVSDGESRTARVPKFKRSNRWRRRQADPELRAPIHSKSQVDPPSKVTRSLRLRLHLRDPHSLSDPRPT